MNNINRQASKPSHGLDKRNTPEYKAKREKAKTRKRRKVAKELGLTDGFSEKHINGALLVDIITTEHLSQPDDSCLTECTLPEDFAKYFRRQAKIAFGDMPKKLLAYKSTPDTLKRCFHATTLLKRAAQSGNELVAFTLAIPKSFWEPYKGDAPTLSADNAKKLFDRLRKRFERAGLTEWGYLYAFELKDSNPHLHGLLVRPAHMANSDVESLLVKAVGTSGNPHHQAQVKPYRSRGWISYISKDKDNMLALLGRSPYVVQQAVEQEARQVYEEARQVLKGVIDQSGRPLDASKPDDKKRNYADKKPCSEKGNNPLKTRASTGFDSEKCASNREAPICSYTDPVTPVITTDTAQQKIKPESTTLDDTLTITSNELTNKEHPSHSTAPATGTNQPPTDTNTKQIDSSASKEGLPAAHSINIDEPNADPALVWGSW
ncbi:hypothetical protein [Zobellella aerophila]|uniref:Replication initiation protein n=1 Tax=Zobellella aerophila TaxID=870480 RepID=A0ABP6W5H3_9GAMM